MWLSPSWSSGGPFSWRRKLSLFVSAVNVVSAFLSLPPALPSGAPAVLTLGLLEESSVYLSSSYSPFNPSSLNSRKNPQFQPDSLIWLCTLFWSVLLGFYQILNFGNHYSLLETIFSDLRSFHFHIYSILLTLLNEFFIWFRFSDSSESIWFRNFLKCSVS